MADWCRHSHPAREMSGFATTAMDALLHEDFQQDIDWPEAWRQHLLRSGLEARLHRAGITQEDFWNRLGKWSRTLTNNGYPGPLLERVEKCLRPGDRVLDIGAGGGAFSVPLAHRASHVTAIEPSPVQASRLSSWAQDASLHNLTVIEQRWEDVDIAAIGVHELVIAVHCFQMEDLRGALSRMCEATQHLLLLIHTAGHDLGEPIRTLFGVEASPGYAYLYNVLCQMGYRPDVEIITRTYLVPLEDQLDMFRYNPGLDEGQCVTLRDYLQKRGRISLIDGEPMIERSHYDAVIRVTK